MTCKCQFDFYFKFNRIRKNSVRNAAANVARFVALLVASLLIMMINGFGVNARTVVYVANADSREIYVLELNGKNGNLKIIEKVNVTGAVMPLAVSPDRKYLYASLRSEPYSVASFAVNPKSGHLTLIKIAPLADNMAYISTDRTGRYLFGASYSGSRISVNAIGPNGEVSPEPLQVIPTGKNAHCILTDSSNKFLFVTNLGDDAILQYRFDSINGHLTPNKPATTETRKGAGPRHFIFHPNGRFVFGTNELDGTLNTYLLGSAGTLELVDSNSLMPAGSPAKPWAADVHLTPDGRFLYASERTTSTITAFRVDGKNGKLTLIDSYPAETQPRGFNIDPDGKYLLVAGQKSNTLGVYEINQKNGILRRVAQMEVGRNPNWIEIIALPK